MNPPPALHSAMSRDRKPFTYTPGGLNLSEIKSERMAKRLMRNAMNQGVPEVPVQPVHSPSNPSAPVALPNYNCMPVQVFPTFNLPANPKSLLRTRSNTDPKDAPTQSIAPPFVNNGRVDNNDTYNNNKYTPTYSQVNNNRPLSMYDYNAPPANTYSLPRMNYGSDAYTAPILPEISYEAEYFRAPPRVYSGSEQLPKLGISEEKDRVPLKESLDTNKDFLFKTSAEVTNPTFASIPAHMPELEIKEEEVPNENVDTSTVMPIKSLAEVINSTFTSIPAQVSNSEIKEELPIEVNVDTREDLSIKPLAEVAFPNIMSITEQVPQSDIREEGSKKENVETSTNLSIKPLAEVTIQNFASLQEQVPQVEIGAANENMSIKEAIDSSIDLKIKPLEEVVIPTIAPTPLETKPAEENASIDNDQSEVKVVKKQVKKENKVEEQNGNQNGDANIEAEMTVKLPTKKAAAKTETKVEVVKKILPDGTVEEVKTTTTKTTIDGRTEIKTKTETRTIPKEEESEEEVVEEEEEEEEEVQEPETTTVTATLVAPKENGQESNVVKTEERSESTTTTTKKVVVVQDSPKEEQSVKVEEKEEEEEEVEDAEPVTVVLKKQATPEPATPVVESTPVEEKEEDEEVEEEETEEVKEVVKEEVTKEVEAKEVIEKEESVEVKNEEVKASPPKNDEEEEEEEYEEAEEIEEAEVKVKQETEVKETKEGENFETAEVVQQNKETVTEKPAAEPKETLKEPEEKIIKVEILPPEELKEAKAEPAPQAEYKIPIREPSIPLEKVEDVEIKPIGSTPIITKTHTENTEIITSKIEPTGGLSTQTEYNKIENIVTVNRTTKILDHNYENLTQQGIPTVRTYFPPPSIDRISTSPLPSRPYQPVYPPEPTTERRHSLLLERLSMERQMPSEIYQYGNQSYDQTQYPGEPRSEVLTVSNVKPSTITDQQWYQQKNVIYNNVASTPTPASQPWAQPKSQPQQQQYQPQAHYQAQHQPQQHYQPPQQQPQFQQSPTPQSQYQPSPTPKPQYQPSPTPQPQYQTSFSERTLERAPSSYSTYTPTPTWVSNTETLQNLTQSNQYSYLNKESSDYQTSTTQQYSSSYVPPPWEQDSSYTSVNNTSQVYYQPAQQTPSESFNSAPAPGWKPPPAKFTKNAPIAYIPPAPNQSFVRSASLVEPPKTPGRKTYYSEYERRYITVPESTYIPSETKYQPQPDPSPQYYYDNNEPAEEVEPQWRRELREFTEKTTTQTTTTEQTNVQPPWENQNQADAKFAKTPSATYTPTPTWSQTLRPRSWRERSFESEYVSQEWPKTNTLGRGRPLSTLNKNVDTVPERTRGVSVDRYNPNNYQSPAEHPPVQSHTLTTPVPGYHNPNVPAYHNRASAEPREQPISHQTRVYREARASPLQSRSFKYLQWITGTEN